MYIYAQTPVIKYTFTAQRRNQTKKGSMSEESVNSLKLTNRNLPSYPPSTICISKVLNKQQRKRLICFDTILVHEEKEFVSHVYKVRVALFNTVTFTSFYFLPFESLFLSS